MDMEKEILLMLEHIERELIEIRRFSHPVSILAVWSSWLMRSVSPIGRNLKKPLWAVLVAAHAFLGRATFGK